MSNLEDLLETQPLEIWRKLICLCMRTIGGQAIILLMLYMSVQAILMSEFNMQCVAAKFVPCLLITEQKEHSVEVCQDLHQCATDDPSFIRKTIFDAINLVYRYNPETKQQSTWWKNILIFFSSAVLCIKNLFPPPGPNDQLRVLLQCFELFEEGHLTKATRSMEHEESDSS